MLFFKSKKPTPAENTNKSQDNIDLQIMNKMNHEFAMSLDLNETLNQETLQIHDSFYSLFANQYYLGT